MTHYRSTYTYDGAGRAATRSDAANLLWTRTYEPETSRIDEQTIAEGNLRYARFDLDHDKAGNVTSRIEKLWDAGDDTTDQLNPPPDPGTGTWTYAYDGAGRMTSATGPDPVDVTRTSTYTYDGAGNRTSVGVSGQNTVTTSFDLQGWPLSSDGGTPQDTGNDTSYAFDAAGNLTGVDAPFSASDLGFTYDAWGLTTGATDGQSGGGSISIGYTLDALGRTTSRTASDTTTSYAYEGLSETLAVMDDPTQTTLYASGPGGPLAEQTGTNVTFYLQDLHGDTVATMRRTGTTLLSETWFSPFGEAVSLQSSPPAIGYQSQMTDPGTGTVDMTTRAYLPSIGRFTTRDVLFGNPKDPMSLNQWAYAGANPVTYWDPQGLSETPATIRDSPSTTAPESTVDALEDDLCDAVCEFDALYERPDIAPVFGVQDEQQWLSRLMELYATDIRPTIDRMQCGASSECYGPMTNEQKALYAGYLQELAHAGVYGPPPFAGCGLLAWKCLDGQFQTPFGLRVGFHLTGGFHFGYGLGSGGSIGISRAPQYPVTGGGAYRMANHDC